MQQIYIELVFLDNFLLDFVLLFCSCRICEKRAQFPHLLAGSAIGGLYSTLAVPLPWLTMLPVKLLVSALMCLPGGLKPWRSYLRRLVCFYSISFLLGGILLSFLTTQNGLLLGGNTFSLRFMLLGLTILCVLTECFARRSFVQARKHYLLTLTLYTHTLQLRAFVDTGNALKDSGGQGVILVSRQFLQTALSDQEYDRLLDPAKADVPTRTFACSTAAGETLLYGFAPVKLTLTDSRKVYALKAYVALADLSLPQNCQALLPPSLRLYPLHDIASKEDAYV